MPTNLPTPSNQDSGKATTLYFNSYGIEPVELPANEVSATIAFFESKGFDKDAAISVSSVILDQARSDGIPVYGILERLKEFNGVQLSALVAEILNNNRPSTSTLGYRSSEVKRSIQVRNIAG
jgi:hypothetical protein